MLKYITIKKSSTFSYFFYSVNYSSKIAPVTGTNLEGETLDALSCHPSSPLPCSLLKCRNTWMRGLLQQEKDRKTRGKDEYYRSVREIHMVS